MRIHRDIFETISKMALPAEYFTKHSAKYAIRFSADIPGYPETDPGPLREKIAPDPITRAAPFFSHAAKSSAGAGGSPSCRIKRREGKQR